MVFVEAKVKSLMDRRGVSLHADLWVDCVLSAFGQLSVGLFVQVVNFHLTFQESRIGFVSSSMFTKATLPFRLVFFMIGYMCGYTHTVDISQGFRGKMIWSGHVRGNDYI